MSTSNSKIKIGIAGGAGYTAGELLRILLWHDAAEITFVHSRSNAGKPLHSIHSDLLEHSVIQFTDQLIDNIDVLFLCLGHGESKAFLQEQKLPEGLRIVDLSQDFRWNPDEAAKGFTYGLPEWNKSAIKEAKKIANPGCFATAIQIALLPLASVGTLKTVHVTGITGATGAGQKLQSSSHFPWRSNNIQVYKALSHQHLFEIKETLNRMQAEVPDIHFIPMRGDFSRGIYICAYSEFDGDIDEAKALYQNYFADHPFCIVSDKQIDLKQTVNTNRCLLYLEKQGKQLIIHACLDNLLKGAAGQAVQNMNLMFGLPETQGLNLKASAF